MWCFQGVLNLSLESICSRFLYLNMRFKYRLLFFFPVECDSVEWELPHLACSVYYSTVQDLPAMVRLWWNSQEKRVSAAVEKFTIKYISPVLSAQEISSVHTSTQMFDSMTVSLLSYYLVKELKISKLV